MSHLVLMLLAFGSLVVLAGQPEPTKETIENGGEESTSQGMQLLTGEEAVALLARETGEKPIVIDVRTAKEFAKGHLVGAQCIDAMAPDFAEKLAQLDRKQTYLFHCRSGSRSQKVAAVWEELGFTHVYHLRTGIMGWEKAGGKTVSGE